MDLSTILSISGKPGLYKLISQTKSGALVESLTDSRRYPAFAHEKISSLEDISIFTVENDISLKKVFQKIYEKENGGDCIDNKAPEKEIRSYMEQVLPEYDKDRVTIVRDICATAKGYEAMTVRKIQKNGGMLV